MKVLTLLLNIFLAVTLAAQTPPTPPSEPLLNKRAPDFSRWIVTTSLVLPQSLNIGDEAGKPEQQQAQSTIEVTKTGKIYHVQFVDSRGEKSDVWVGGPISAREPMAQGTNAEFVAPPPDKDSTNPLFIDFSKSDFDKFNWISATNYQGTKKMLGRECLYFSDKVKVGTSSAAKEGASDGAGFSGGIVDFMEAYIDAETRLPVARSSSNGGETYKFLTPPTAMQVVPQSVRDLVQKQIDLNQSLSRKPGKPF